MKQFASLRDYIIRDRWYLAAGFAALIGVDLLQLIIPLVIKSAVDDLIGAAYTENTLLRHGLLIVAIGFNLLNMAKIRIGNLLPALVYAVLWALFRF